MWGGLQETIHIGEKWQKGTMLLQPFDKALKPKEIPVEDFFHKIVKMCIRDRGKSLSLLQLMK